MVLWSVLDVGGILLGMPPDTTGRPSIGRALGITTRHRRVVPAAGLLLMKPTAGAKPDARIVFAAGVLGVLVAAETVLIALLLIGPNPIWDFGMDYRFYRDLGVRWLSDGTYYSASQLAGPHGVDLLGAVPPGSEVTLYPPSALFLFVPFTFLPAILWWAVPMTVTGYVVYRLRPVPWAWVLMLVMLAYPRAVGAYLFGNTDMWIAAGVAAGLRWGWPALALTMKPSFAVLALIGVRHRSWWIAAALGAVSIFAMLPLWADYVLAMRNIRGLDLGYSLGSLPLVLAPLVAWLGRSVPVAEHPEPGKHRG
jgi:hypothetical protein